ncbi:MAG: alpha/beta fold hydrolase [Hyphomonadaceae bacterium]|nr:alpha/beta fold hydrolase [Hyphomonadaceae bacterium]
MLAACAPTVQSAHRSLDEAPAGPHFNIEAQRFYSFDGAPLGLSSWLPPEGRQPWAVIIGLHGMNDYGEAFYLAGPWFAERGVAVFAYDARGFGRSPNRGVWGGEQLMTEDLRAAVNAARRAHPNAVLAVVGDSMGSATAIAAFGSSAPPNADRLILTAPAVWGWSAMPDAYAVALWVGAHSFPWRTVSPPRGVQRRITPSDNIEMLRRIGRDPNMLFSTRIDAVYGLVSLMETASRRTARLSGDVAFLYGARDQIIPRHSALAAAERLPAGARTAIYADGYHMLLRDNQREVVYADILSYLRDPAAPFPSAAPSLVERMIQANR